MNLTEVPDTVTWPKTHHVFVEKVGPFQTNAPEAWHNLHSFISRIAEHNQITGYLSLYKMEPQVYRAGVSLAAPPANLPPDLGYMEFSGGKYSRFVLTGPYPQLGKATGRVMQIVSETHLPLRDDYYLENYVNDPRTTPEDQLVTEILVPTI
jgi:effector-binding domain-containing protein